MQAKHLLLALALPAAALSAQEAPQSAIPWLSDSITTTDPVRPTETPATAITETEITVMPLGQTRRDAVGLLSPALTGLPADTVAASDPARLIDLLMRQPTDALPAMQTLLLRVLLAELDPPRAATDPDAWFFARIDALLRFGALDQAQAMLERAGATDKRAFRRWFDTSLLTGFDTRACAAMTANPGVAPTLPARIFCLSRSGDWAAAALTLDTGRAIGAISDEEDALLALFLDPEMFEGAPPPVPPRPMTPLAFRLLDGVGETPDTRDLPLAFAVSDLRATIGWKAQIEAAERLTRVQALDPNRLLSLYTERRPAASGGVWDRAAAVQRLDAALLGGNAEAIAQALPEAMARLADSHLLVTLADLYGARVAQANLTDGVRGHALRLGLLSGDYEAIARRALDDGWDVPPDLAFAAAVATGADTLPARFGTLPQAVAEGMTGTPPEALLSLAAEARLGEALLETGLLVADRADSDPRAISEAIAFLRAAGLQDSARRLALQILLL
ncbi:hypothetical protein JANAI62_23460 [Jannaschia pagri]|uniref:Uncharacterized protein n=1 Tax=Jannaschia pagri TaxID=2829797 RepID=A0ABQ4NMT4_9RHOB|nr:MULTISPECIES: hypothetical protein [unclassified Jannaschia]GIT91889.1 hypothetical protein JANAI61_23470 [Jannaschia sp. AI_61]GIT95723.1 hypothetical protein JANAI62_23460 [Jannaschia sp. AI_62]